MKKNFAKYLSIMLVVALMASVLVGCGSDDGGDAGGDSAEVKKIGFAYQYGLQYLPVKIIKEKGLIEKYYDGEVEIDWQTLNSGAAINEAMVAGSIQAGVIGTPVAVTGINAGVPYKIVSGTSNIGNKMIVNDDSIQSLADFAAGDTIALVNIGSVQHITLAIAAKELLGDAHALDDQITGLAHPDGMTALLSGSVKGHFTTIPYWGKELAEEGNHEITEVAENAMPGASIIVSVVSTDLYEEEPELYEAIVKAYEEAMEYVNDESNFEEIAEDMYEDEGITKEEMIEYLKSDDVKFDSVVTGLMEFAQFMTEEAFLDEAASEDEADYIFDGVELKSIESKK